MGERTIISLTTWKPRICNLPIVLDTIYNQTVQPDKIVLNIAYNEVIPTEITTYIEKHNIEVNYVEDTKVYKKLIPTLKKYPNDCIINIDDDCIYPNYMIEDFLETHKKYPNHPISGNRVVLYGMQCHCGCASLTKADYFGEWLDVIDNNIINNCKSSDIVMTFFANKNNNPYIRTKALYFTNLTQQALSSEPYSVSVENINSTIKYLTKRFGTINADITAYVNDYYLSKIMKDVLDNKYTTLENEFKFELEKIYSTFSFKLGSFLTSPFRWLLNILKTK